MGSIVYFMRVHFEEKHKTFDLTRYEHLWKLSNFEKSEMKIIWAKRGKVTMKRTKKLKIRPLTISERHRARIPGMYVAFCLFGRMKRDHCHVSFPSDDRREPHLSEPHSSSPEEEEDENTETEGMDVDDKDGGDAEEDTGGFWERIVDLDNVASVRNSVECELEAVITSPIYRTRSYNPWKAGVA